MGLLPIHCGRDAGRSEATMSVLSNTKAFAIDTHFKIMTQLIPLILTKS